jgi:hypothetical protein
VSSSFFTTSVILAVFGSTSTRTISRPLSLAALIARRAALPEMPQVWVDAIGAAMAEYVREKIAEHVQRAHDVPKSGEILDPLPSSPMLRKIRSA